MDYNKLFLYSNIILIGEKHGVEENFNLYLEQIIKSCEVDNVTVFFEVGFSSGYYINEYIKGNELFPINEFISEFKGTMYGTEKFTEFIINLKNIKIKNIEIKGIDVEFQTNNAKRLLKQNTDKTIASKIQIGMEDKKILDACTDDEFEKLRENMIYKNFINEYKDNKKYLCFLGAWHTKDCENNLRKKLVDNGYKIEHFEIIYKNTYRTIKENRKNKSN